jgi:hypothetical protein
MACWFVSIMAEAMRITSHHITSKSTCIWTKHQIIHVVIVESASWPTGSRWTGLKCRQFASRPEQPPQRQSPRLRLLFLNVTSRGRRSISTNCVAVAKARRLGEGHCEQGCASSFGAILKSSSYRGWQYHDRNRYWISTRDRYCPT